MVVFSCVVNCESRAQRDNVHFFRIPAERHFKHKAEINELSRLRRQKWINAINRKDLTEQKLKYAFVCSKHFTTGKPSVLIDTTHPDWVPTVNMGYGTTKGLASKKLLRYQRKQRRHEVAWEASAPSTSDAVVVGESEQADMQETDESRIISVDSLRTDSTKLKYYTGLPSNSHFDMVMKLIEPHIPVMVNTALSAKNQIILTLIKLRLNLDFKDLAYRFGVSFTSASSYFKCVINVMYQRLKYFVFWPKRDDIVKMMPHCFKESFADNTTIIIDCFEIKSETPSNLLTAAQSWSNYKHSQTIKYLIGITPQGSVCFISEAWGGRLSDTILTKNSIIHVERVIGVLRQKYRILEGTLPISLLSTGGSEPILNKIVHLCCALINMCPPIVPL
nr:unnamed protein product [Callosobruchus analis]